MKLYSNVTCIFVIWLVSVLLISYFTFSTLPHSGKFSNNFWQSLANWDGGHFLGIAQFGYREKFQYAFFPLYPLAIKAVNEVTENYLVAAILISVLSTFLGLQLLYKLVGADFDKKLAEKVVIILLLFPTSFFLVTAYSEGLFFFLTVATFYFLRQNKLLLASFAAALASATRVAGLAVVVALLVDVGTREGIRGKNWYVLLAPLGFFIYCLYLFRQTGDPFYFITAENHWQRVLAPPQVAFWEALKSISYELINLNLRYFLDLAFAIFGVGFAIRTFRFLPFSWAVYSLLSISIPLFTSTISSIPRFLVVIFPIFILMAFIKNYYLQFALQIFSTMLLTIFIALFITGYWVS